VVAFSLKNEARAAASHFRVGDQTGPVPEVVYHTIEVREVLANL
jgi:hypothetical protein